MLEKHIESRLVRKCKAIGVPCEKFTSPGRRSVPDRIIMVGEGQVIFVELKAPGKMPTHLQAKDHERRRAMGYKVLVIDSEEKVDTLVASIDAVLKREGVSYDMG